MHDIEYRTTGNTRSLLCGEKEAIYTRLEHSTQKKGGGLLPKEPQGGDRLIINV